MFCVADLETDSSCGIVGGVHSHAAVNLTFVHIQAHLRQVQGVAYAALFDNLLVDDGERPCKARKGCVDLSKTDIVRTVKRRSWSVRNLETRTLVLVGFKLQRRLQKRGLHGG